MPKSLPAPEVLLAWLTCAPDRIADTTNDIEPAALRSSPGPGEWSAVELLAHLRSCADVWGGCIARILGEERPTIRAVDPRAWTKQTDYLDLAFAESLTPYTSQRERLVEKLSYLTPELWAREASVTGAGKPLVRTVHFYAGWLATHERTHLKQMERIIATLRGERATSHTGRHDG